MGESMKEPMGELGRIQKPKNNRGTNGEPMAEPREEPLGGTNEGTNGRNDGG